MTLYDQDRLISHSTAEPARNEAITAIQPKNDSFLLFYHVQEREFSLLESRKNGCFIESCILSAPELSPIGHMARVTVDFKAITIGVIKVHGPTDKVIDGGHRNVCFGKSAVCLGEGMPIWDFKGDVIETGAIGRWMRCVGADLLQCDIMMKLACAEEGIIGNPLCFLKFEITGVEVDRTLKVTYFEMCMADFGCIRHEVPPESQLASVLVSYNKEEVCYNAAKSEK